MHPREICRNQKRINGWAPGLSWGQPGWDYWNCHWLWDTMESHKTRLIRIRNFLKWLLKGVSLFCHLPFLLLLQAWASALMDKHAAPVPYFSLPSIFKSSWDAPRAKMSSCLLHWDNQTSNIGKEVTSQCHVVVHRQPGECTHVFAAPVLPAQQGKQLGGFVLWH